MENDQDKPKHPTLEEFEHMSVQEKMRLFTGLPVSAQKVLIAISAFASSVQSRMAQVVSKTNPEEFEEAQTVLTETPFFSIREGRLIVGDSMKSFINTDLKSLWEQQKEKSGQSE